MRHIECSNIAMPAVRVYGDDIIDLSRRPFTYVAQMAKDILDRFYKFEGECFGAIPRDIYNEYVSIFHIALLKLSVILEEKSSQGSPRDEIIDAIINMYTADEKNAIKDFERFSKLDPRVSPPEVLAEVIVSRSGEIYELVREAVAKQYIDFSELIKTWTKEKQIRDAVARGLIARYEVRFRNVVEAIKRLIDQQPAWIVRLFSEYEQALLESSQVRSYFEKKYREVFDEGAKKLEERIRQLEEERGRLAMIVETLSARVTEGERLKREAEEEVIRIRRSYEELRAKYEQILSEYASKLEELEDLKRKLAEKERALAEMAERERANAAAREALEAELHRLGSLVKEYEEKVKGYEALKESLNLELDSLREKVGSLERILRGEVKGSPIYSEEAALMELIFINKLASKLRSLPMRMKTPWGEEEVSRWDEEYIASETPEQEHGIPQNRSVVFVARKRSYLGLGEERHLEIRGVFYSHRDTLKRQGYDDRPATLSELLSILSKVTPGISSSGKSLVVLGISSPTEWEERAVEYVRGLKPGGSLVFKDLAVVLVDQVRGEVHYFQSPWIEYYANLFRPEISEDEERRVEETIKVLCEEAYATSPEAPSFTEKELLERIGSKVGRLSVLRVVRRHIEKKALEIKFARGEKIMLCRKTT